MRSGRTKTVFLIALGVALLALGARGDQFAYAAATATASASSSASADTGTTADTPTVELYGTYDFTVQNSRVYANPFDLAEIALTANFTSPTGRQITITGFYDGDGNGGNSGDVWRVRFMPDETGVWQYQYQWSDGTPGGSGQLTVTPNTDSARHGHVHRDPNHPRYLIYDDGTPAYLWGGKWFNADNYGPAEKNGEANPKRDTDQQITDYFDTMASYQHNGTRLEVALYPLENDKMTWDLDWLHRLEWLVTQAAQRGIYIQLNLFDTWSRDQYKWFVPNTEGDMQVFNAWTATDMDAKRNYIRTLVAHFAGFYNVYWELGNEMEHSPNSGTDFVNLANKYYLPWLHDADPYHLPVGLSEGIWQTTEVDIGLLHQTLSLPPLTASIGSLPESYKVRPTMMTELVSGGDAGPLWNDDTIRNPASRYSYRRTFWRMFTYGGSGSCEASWLYLDRPLNSAVDAVMSDQEMLRKMIAALPVNINTMEPLANWVVSGPPNTDYSRTRATPGEVYVTYFAAGGDRGGSAVQLSKLPTGLYKAEWLNPETGQTVGSTSLLQGGTAPVINSPQFTDDIVLEVIRDGLKPDQGLSTDPAYQPFGKQTGSDTTTTTNTSTTTNTNSTGTSGTTTKKGYQSPIDIFKQFPSPVDIYKQYM